MSAQPKPPHTLKRTPQMQGAAKPAVAPQPVRHHHHVHPLWGFVIWLAGGVVWCVLSMGPAKYLEIRLMRQDMFQSPLASVEFVEPEQVFDEATAFLNAAGTTCYRNKGGGRSCEPASAPPPEITTEDVSLSDLRLASIYLNTAPWTVQFLPSLAAAAITYLGGTLMTLLALLLASRRG